MGGLSCLLQPPFRDAAIAEKWFVHKQWHVVHKRAQTMHKRCTPSKMSNDWMGGGRGHGPDLMIMFSNGNWAFPTQAVCRVGSLSSTPHLQLYSFLPLYIPSSAFRWRRRKAMSTTTSCFGSTPIEYTQFVCVERNVATFFGVSRSVLLLCLYMFNTTSRTTPFVAKYTLLEYD